MSIGHRCRVGLPASMEMSSGRRYELACSCAPSRSSLPLNLKVNDDVEDCSNVNMLPYDISICSEDISPHLSPLFFRMAFFRV